MLLQPIVENALKHGLAAKSARRDYDRTSTRDARLIIEIEDNGVGIPRTACRKSRRRHRNQQRPRAFARALRRRFPNEYFQPGGEGTRIRIEIPS